MSDQEPEVETKEERREKLLKNLAKGRATRLENIKKKKTVNVVQEVSCRFCGKSYKSPQYKDKHELICKKRPVDEKPEQQLDDKQDDKQDDKPLEPEQPLDEKPPEETPEENIKLEPKKKKKKKIIYESDSSSSSEEEVIIKKKKKSKKKASSPKLPIPALKKTITIAQYEELKRRREEQMQLRKMKEQQEKQHKMMEERVANMLNGVM